MSEFLKDKLKGFWGLNAVKSFLPDNPSDGDTLVYNSTSGEWEPGYPTDPELITEVVEISSAEILAWGDFNKTDLLTIPSGQYPVFENIFIEFEAGSVDYTGTFENLNLYYGMVEYWANLGTIMKTGTNGVVQIRFNSYDTVFSGANGELNPFTTAGDTLKIGKQGFGTTLLTGDGILRVIIQYRVRTLGA